MMTPSQSHVETIDVIVSSDLFLFEYKETIIGKDLVQTEV